jgi:putative tryptophan/tyrosine transport system substrate-binding protein
MITLLGLLLATFISLGVAQAQQNRNIPLIGYLGTTADPIVGGRRAKAFLQGLVDVGRIEGRNIHIEYRYIEGEQNKVPSLVSELLQLKSDVLVLQTLTSLRAVKQLTTTTPVVMVASNDPVETGIVDSLARPGGNITGIARLTRELNGKRLELLKEVLPGISRVGVLWDTNGPGPAASFKEYEDVGRSLKLAIQSLEFSGPDPDWNAVFKPAAKARAGAIIGVGSSVLQRHARRITEVAVHHRIPFLSDGNDYVQAGGLMSYSSNNEEMFRQAAIYVDKILKGANPANLPVEQPAKFDLIINLKTAKQIGLTIPPNVLARADKVIK